MSIGQKMHELAKKLWPINRSITGEGFRESLRILQGEVPEIKIHSIDSGQKVFDWTIPQEWSVKEAYIVTP